MKVVRLIREKIKVKRGKRKGKSNRAKHDDFTFLFHLFSFLSPFDLSPKGRRNRKGRLPAAPLDQH
jgi:hypothetical protein